MKKRQLKILPNSMKTINTELQEVQPTPSTRNRKKQALRPISKRLRTPGTHMGTKTRVAGLRCGLVMNLEAVEAEPA